MSGWVGRRVFLKQAGAATLLAAGGPLVLRSRASAQSDRLVVAVGQWGTETPLPWRNTQAEKPLWDHVFDPLIQRDSKTFAYQPGLATEWKPSSEMRTWTFKLRSGVMFHEGFGEMTSEDVKYTVEQSFKPDAIGGSAYFFRNHLDKIETPDKSTVVMRFKSPQWMVPSLFSQYVGYQNVVSEEIRGVGRRAKSGDPSHRHRPLSPRRRQAGRLSPLRGGAGSLAEGSRVQGAAHPPHPRAGDSAVRRARRRDRHRPGLRRLPGAGAEGLAAHPRESQCRAVLGDHDGPDHAGPRGLLPDLPVGGRSRQSEEPGERPESAPGPQPRGEQEGHHRGPLEGQGQRDAVLVLLLSLPQGLQRGVEGPAVRPRARQEAPRRSRAWRAASRCG